MCELVKNPDTEVYYEDDYMIILKNIDTHNYDEKRLCIWKNHQKHLVKVELSVFFKKLLKIKNELNKTDKWWDIVISLQSNPQHFHMHLARRTK